MTGLDLPLAFLYEAGGFCFAPFAQRLSTRLLTGITRVRIPHGALPGHHLENLHFYTHSDPLVERIRYRTFNAAALGSIPAGIMRWPPGQMVKIPPSQGGDAGFNSRGGCCGRRTTVVRQIVALHTGVRLPPATPRMGLPSWPKAAVCKTVTTETSQVQILPHPRFACVAERSMAPHC